MATVDIIATAGGLADATLSNNASGLSTLNTDTQLAASAAGLRANISIGSAASAVVLGEAALSTGLAVLSNDIKTARHDPTTSNVGNAFADAVTVFGDIVIVGTGYANGASLEFPEVKPELALLSAAGAGLACLGIAIHAGTGGYNEGLDKLEGFASAFVDDAENGLSRVEEAIASDAGGAFGFLQSALSDINGIFQDAISGNTSDFQSEDTALNQDATRSALAYAGGVPSSEQLPQSLSVSVLNNIDVNGTVQSVSETNSDGSSQNLDSSNAGLLTLRQSASAQGASSVVQEQANGSLKSTVTNYSGPNATGQPKYVLVNNADGSTDTTTPGTGGAYTLVHADPKTGVTEITLSNGTDYSLIEVSGLKATYNHRVYPFSLSSYNVAPDNITFTYKGGTNPSYVPPTIGFTYPNAFRQGPYIYGVPGSPFAPSTQDTAIFNTIAHGYDHVSRVIGSQGVVNVVLASNFPVSGTYNEQIPVYVSDFGQTGTAVLNLKSTMYAIAIAQVSTTLPASASYHVGDVLHGSVVVTNTADGALPDALIVSSTTTPTSPVALTLPDASETILGGQTATIPIAITLQTMGLVGITNGLSFISHDSFFSDVQAVSNSNVNLAVAAYNYAAPRFVASNGISVTQNGNVWTIDLGNAPQGTPAAPFDVQISNAASGYLADSLSGTFGFQGNGFTVTGATSFSNTDQLHITNTATTAGAQTETITLHPVSSNSSGYSGALADQTLIIKQTVVGPTLSSPDPLFDPAYYLAQYPDVKAAGVDPYQHYMTIGWKEGRNPSALFNTTYYLNQNPDVKAAGINPLSHFETFGWKEGRDPSILFSDSLYLSHNSDVQAAGINPLLHYTVFGKNEGRAIYAATPHQTSAFEPAINPDYIYAQHPEVATAGLDATIWYHSTGWKLGTNPDAYFDTNYYLAQNPDVKAAGVDPLTHYETYGWKEGRDPSLLFSTSKYITAYPYLGRTSSDPLTLSLTYGKQLPTFLTGATEVANALVDPSYYDKQLGATLIPTGIAAAQQATASYDQGGWLKGLNPDAFFNTAYYLAHNPDVAAAHVNPLLHYEIFGWKEGRDPSAVFSTNKYLAAYADVKAAGIDPLIHYVQFGQAEGRTAFTV